MAKDKKDAALNAFLLLQNALDRIDMMVDYHFELDETGNPIPTGEQIDMNDHTFATFLVNTQNELADASDRLNEAFGIQS